MNNKSKAILGKFAKAENISNIKKGLSINVEEVDKLGNVDIFSKSQIAQFIENGIEESVGRSAEVKKGIADSIKNEYNKLIPFTMVNSDGKEKQFFASKKDSCPLLKKAFDPYGDGNSDYFREPDFDEDSIIEFINQSNPSKEDIINEFGDEVEEFLNSLVESGKVSLGEDDTYSVTDDNTNSDEDLNVGGNEDDENDSDIANTDNDKDNDGFVDGEDNEDENKEGDEDDEAKEMAKLNDEDEDGEDGNEDEQKNEEIGDKAAEDAVNHLEEKEQNTNPFTEGEETAEQADESGNQEEADKAAALADNSVDENAYSPEELENFAKKTADASLIRFYKNSNDENLKNVVKIELQRRGVELPNDNGEDGEPTEQNQLKKWIDQYFEDYDLEDLRKYVVELIAESPKKTKELKEHYRKAYSISNGGNSVFKIDEKEFKEWLEDTYLPNFAFGDLKDYAFKLLSNNPAAIKKMKGLYKDFQENTL